MSGFIKKDAKNKDEYSYLSSAFRLEANTCASGITIVVSGIIGISDFSDNRVVLLSHRGRVSVLGKKLSLTVFENKNAEICGRVEEVIFGYGKN